MAAIPLSRRQKNMTDSHPQTGFTELSPFPASRNPNVAPKPLCLSLTGLRQPLHCSRRACVTLEGVTLPLCYLGWPCINPAWPLCYPGWPCVAPAAFVWSLLNCIAPRCLCAALVCCLSALVVLLAWDQTIPFASTTPCCSWNTSEILSKPRSRIPA